MDKEGLFRSFIKLKQLTNYERFVLLCLAYGASAKSAQQYIRKSVDKFKRVEKLLRDFIIYRTIYIRNKKMLDRFLKKNLTSKQYEVMKRIILFPIRSTKYYVKFFSKYKVSQGCAYGIKAIVERSVERLMKNAVEEIQKEFLKYFVRIVFGGRLRRKFEKRFNRK